MKEMKSKKARQNEKKLEKMTVVQQQEVVLMVDQFHEHYPEDPLDEVRESMIAQVLAEAKKQKGNRCSRK